MLLGFPYILAGSFVVALLVIHRFRSRSISNIPGPPPGSWLVGNIPEVLRPINVGDADISWTKTFGTAVRIKGIFGRDVLFITDPKAFHFILNSSCYNFPRSSEFRVLSELFMGPGIIWAEGADHSRHRRIMETAFSYGAIKEHLPTIRRTIQQTVAIWKDITTESGTEIDVLSWMSRTTLDILGTTAFDYQFGSLENATSTELYQFYKNLFVDALLERSDYSFAFEAVCGIIPRWLLIILLSSLPYKASARLKNYSRTAQRVAQSLVNQQLELLNTGKDGSQDILSRLVSANLSAAPKNRLSNDELLAQLRTLMIAGFETSASTISWALYGLSLNPKFQNELREEIKATRARSMRPRDAGLTITELESMRLLDAVLKETLRYHPILPQMQRIAGCDIVIPLSTPQRTKTGQVITEIPVNKGQGIILSISAFNRLQSVWGDDADVWRPQRFLEEMNQGPKTGVGVYANIATFSSGGRSCIGWRSAMLEMRVVLAELIENFEFSPPPGNIEIRRAAITTMCPMVKGSTSGHAELPLTVTPLT